MYNNGDTLHPCFTDLDSLIKLEIKFLTKTEEARPWCNILILFIKIDPKLTLSFTLYKYSYVIRQMPSPYLVKKKYIFVNDVINNISV